MGNTKGKWTSRRGFIVTGADLTGNIICDSPEGWEDSMSNWEANAKRICLTNNNFDELLNYCKYLLNMDICDSSMQLNKIKEIREFLNSIDEQS